VPEYKYIPIEQLVEPPNPIRATMDEAALMSLAESIKAVGVLQPPIVVPLPLSVCGHCGFLAGDKCQQHYIATPQYEIVAGHRRYKACIIANLNAVPCLVFADAEIAKFAALIAENTERQDVTPAEEAIWFDELIKKYDFTEDQLLSTVKRSANYVYERLALFNGHQAVFEALKDKQINMAVAKQLNRCKNESDATYLLGLAVQGGATALTVSKWVTEANHPRGEDTSTPVTADGVNQTPAVTVEDDRRCVLCRRNHQPLNLVPVWVHDWELRDLNERIDNAANPGDESSLPGAGA
jgi:ParB/RepB/Spo0J family partition protein